jgi:hypothetical protein
MVVDSRTVRSNENGSPRQILGYSAPVSSSSCAAVFFASSTVDVSISCSKWTRTPCPSERIIGERYAADETVVTGRLHISPIGNRKRKFTIFAYEHQR